jgi:hypothetical protein
MALALPQTGLKTSTTAFYHRRNGFAVKSEKCARDALQRVWRNFF